jgi:hypothetical protein
VTTNGGTGGAFENLDDDGAATVMVEDGDTAGGATDSPTDSRSSWRLLAPPCLNRHIRIAREFCTKSIRRWRQFKREASFAEADLWRCRPEQFLDRLRCDRFTEVITLHFVAIVFPQKRHLIISLDPLSDDPQIQLLTQ